MNPIPLKQWVHEEAARAGLTPEAIFRRRLKGWYPDLAVLRVSRKTIFVESRENVTARSPAWPRAGESRLKDWLATEAARAGVTAATIRHRLTRGKYPALVLRRFNKRVVFVVETNAFKSTTPERDTDPGVPALARGLQKRTLKVPQSEKEKSQ